MAPRVKCQRVIIEVGGRHVHPRPAPPADRDRGPRARRAREPGRRAAGRPGRLPHRRPPGAARRAGPPPGRVPAQGRAPPRARRRPAAPTSATSSSAPAARSTCWPGPGLDHGHRPPPAAGHLGRPGHRRAPGHEEIRALARRDAGRPVGRRRGGPRHRAGPGPGRGVLRRGRSRRTEVVERIEERHRSLELAIERDDRARRRASFVGRRPPPWPPSRPAWSLPPSRLPAPRRRPAVAWPTPRSAA